MDAFRKCKLFFIGGGAYMGLEMLWRGRTHGSMFFAGGACFLLTGKLRRLPLPLRAVAGGLGITAVELAAGLLVNRDHRVWDYRELPGNFRGQICPQFTALWMPLSLAAGWLYERLAAAMKN